MTKQQQINFSRFTLIGIAVVCIQMYHVSGTECGTVSQKFTFSSRILGGESVSRGDWPFIAALYRVEHSEYFCGGTLISNKHILTGNDANVVVYAITKTIKFQLPTVYNQRARVENFYPGTLKCVLVHLILQKRTRQILYA